VSVGVRVQGLGTRDEGRSCRVQGLEFQASRFGFGV
jgi:hypothetical protein